MGVFNISLDLFHGPLDLLLVLAEGSEIDLGLLSLASVTQQFCIYISIIENVDIDEAAEYILVAVALLEFKVASLLPKHTCETQNQLNEQSNPIIIDSKDDLLKQLEEYRKYRDMAVTMMGYANRQEQKRPRKPIDLGQLPAAFHPVELWDLVSTYARFLRETNPAKSAKIKEEYLPLEILMRQTENEVQRLGKISLVKIIQSDVSISRLIGIFLAVLELVKKGSILAVQDTQMGEIVLLAPSFLLSLRAA